MNPSVEEVVDGEAWWLRRRKSADSRLLCVLLPRLLLPLLMFTIQHDTYAERMNILSLIYSIPPPPHSPSSAYLSSVSTSADSTRPSSPGSPPSDSSDHLSREPSAVRYDDVDDRRFSQETARYRGELFNGRDSPEGTRSSRFPWCNLTLPSLS